ncbi:MAG: ferredoxin [Actinobacteria bacterium]|nr:ferredoxin [Actinomycetota bacterium]
MRVHVDPRLCEGHGLCLQLAPDVFDLDDDETATCDEHPNPGALADIRAASAACPRQAIAVDEAVRTNSGTKE